jgi:hypothetical protein
MVAASEKIAPPWFPCSLGLSVASKEDCLGGIVGKGSRCYGGVLYRGENLRHVSASSCLSRSSSHCCFLVYLVGVGATGGEKSAGSFGGGGRDGSWGGGADD